jgi:hypothetical protein
MKVDVDGTYVNPTTLLATVENQPAPGRIKILKQDELDKHVIAACSSTFSRLTRKAIPVTLWRNDDRQGRIANLRICSRQIISSVMHCQSHGLCRSALERKDHCGHG